MSLLYMAVCIPFGTDPITISQTTQDCVGPVEWLLKRRSVTLKLLTKAI